jgi:hypothetical protein
MRIEIGRVGCRQRIAGTRARNSRVRRGMRPAPETPSPAALEDPRSELGTAGHVNAATA